VNWRGQPEDECLWSHAEMGLQDLTNIHAARDTKRIQHDLYWRSICQEGHIFFRNDAGDDAFISVATSHLISDAQLALARDINFDLLDDAAIDVVASLYSII